MCVTAAHVVSLLARAKHVHGKVRMLVVGGEGRCVYKTGSPMSFVFVSRGEREPRAGRWRAAKSKFFWAALS